MRPVFTALTVLGCVSAASACGVTDSEPTHKSEPSTVDFAPPAIEPPSHEDRLERGPRWRTPIVSDDSFSEVVYVLMHDWNSGLWFCTGTLVSSRDVLTAAHCIDPTMFARYEIVAPLAPGRPHVFAFDPKLYGGPYDIVENPDIGFLSLTKPIELPRYAELTNVVARVETGESLDVISIVRTQAVPEAPLAMSKNLALSSSVELGYKRGYKTPYFSKGGDSGAGLFLFENGRPTHKLVAVLRQPEPSRDIDHATRVDAEFLDWMSAAP
ncbi:MAG TPA: trypsin-like serine protease [Labilithrix sp.]|nr:trypsin-like serine protease [Labilithrix sp.]